MPATPRAALTAAETTFVARARVGHLATADAAGRPHVVPVCYAYDGARFYIALDEKPKRASDHQLRRVRNLSERPEASLVIDHYEDDWSRLGWVLVHARAALLDPSDPGHAPALALLRDRYPLYRGMALEDRPVIALTPDAVTSWGTAADTLAPTAPAAAASAAASTTVGRPFMAASGEPAMAAGAEQPTGRGADFLPIARGRHVVRRYQPRAVPRALVEQTLEAARWAPSPHGRQPWRFVVLTRAEPKARLAEAMGDEWRRNLEMDGQDADAVSTRLELSRERIRRAPVAILACLYLTDLDHYPDPSRRAAEEIMAIQSLGAALQNLLLAAYTLGLDGGWMCAPLFCPDIVRAALDLDPALIPHALITLGYAARDPERRPHRPISDLVARWD
jgi:PPOX class probable F420-dependent enzyme